MAQVKLQNIYWKVAAPDPSFGTYSGGDSIDTYWDTTANDYYVTLNGVQVTGATGNIPPTFTYNSQNQDYYLTRTVYQSSTCSGTSLLNFQIYALFPYLAKSELPNHPNCLIPNDPVVCDLDFDTLPLVTGVSAAGVLDGQIVVSASGSNGAVQYRLNSDFVYNDGTAQSSGTFTGLGEGNYLVYSRDAVNCLAIQSVAVGIANTYGVKYRLTYYDHRQPQSLKAYHKTEILEKDYAGAVSNVKGGASPTVLSVRAEGERDKFVALLPTEMVFTLMTDTNQQYSDLYTNDPTKYRMRHSVDNTVVWTGRVLPNQYEASYNSRVDEVKIVATDGLALLQSEYFVDSDNNRLSGELRSIAVIAWILNKIGLGLNIRSACNIYATGMTTTAASDPLDQAYVDVSRYYLIDEVPTCWDVLKYILEPFGAQIVLYNNVWNIIRVEERTRSFDYREFDSNGNYSSNGSYDPIKDLKRSGSGNRIVWADGTNQLFKINPGFGTIRLLYNLGLKKNLFINGDFSVKKYSVYQANVGGGTSLVQGTIPDLEGFQLVNNGTVITTGVDILEDDNVAVQLTTNEIGGYLQSEVIDLKLGNADGFKLTFRYMAFNRLPPASSILTYDPLMPYIKVKIKVIYGIYYLMSNGGWTSTDSSIHLYVTPDQILKYQTFTVTALTPIDTYINGEDFQIIVYAANAMDYDYGTFVALRAVQTYSTGPTLPIDFRTEAIDASYPNWLYYYQLQNTTSAESAPDIIRPDDYNASTNPVQWVKINATIINTYETTLSIDKVQIEVLSNTKKLPEVLTSSRSMENANKLPLNRIIYHGSLVNNSSSEYKAGLFPEGFFDGTIPGLSLVDLYHIDEWWLRSLVSRWEFTANSADKVYSGYFRNATGGGYTTWFRDAVSELRPLENIFMDMNSSQYNTPWRSIHGAFIGDVIFSPIDVMRETMDDNRIYYPVFLEVDYRANSYNAQFLELTDVIAASGSGAEFDFDFDESFNS